MYAWEDSFAERVARYRKNEIKDIKKNAYIKSINYTSVFSSTSLIALATVRKNREKIRWNDRFYQNI